MWTSPVRAGPPEHRCVGLRSLAGGPPPGGLTQHADDLGVLQHGAPAGGLHGHTHVPRAREARRHPVVQGQQGLQGHSRVGPGRGRGRAGPAAGPLAGAAARRQGMGQRGAWGGPRRSRVEADAAWTPVFQRLPPAPPLWMVQEAYVASGWASTHRPCPSEAWLAQHPACGAGRIYLVAGLPQTIQIGAEALGAQLQVSTLRAEGTAQACARPARGPPLGPYSPSPPGLRVWALRHCLRGFLLGGTGLKFAE